MARDPPERIASTFDRLFRTKRLIFRALENCPEHTAFLRDMVMDEPENYAQSTDRLLAPVTTEDVENDVASLVKSLLAVIICLRPEHDNTQTSHRREEGVRRGATGGGGGGGGGGRGGKGGNRIDEDEDEEDDVSSDRDSNHCSSSTSSPPTLTAIGWLTLSCHALTLHHRSCTLGIMIASAHQDRGYGTEAVNWALDWAFRVAGMHAVRLSCFSFNERAAKLYTSLGFVREGVKREAYYFDCKWYNRIMFSILDREWAARRGGGGGGGGGGGVVEKKGGRSMEV